MFENITNWKLLKGSHDFPGPDGGTCINEAAIIAAGFEYKRVASVTDCPPCFSKVIAAYAIGLNDRMPNAFRNELLMPFVTRLSGTADTKEIEAERTKFIVLETTRKINAYLCRKWLNREDLAQKCEAVKTFAEVTALRPEIKKADASYAAAYAAASYAAAYAAYAAAYDADAAAYAAAYAADAAYAAYAAAYDAAYAADAADAADAAERKIIWTMAANILDGAIKLGKQSTPEDTAVIVERLEKAKRERIAA